jgi:5'-nucleotidase
MKSSVPAAVPAVIALSVFAMSPLAAGTSATATEPITIAQVQGTHDVTPHQGEVVTVDGIVTADLRGSDGIGATYLQSAVPSGTAGASDGILVLDLPDSVRLGDLVRVTGVAQETRAETSIVAASATTIATDAAAPEPVVFTGADAEAFEGMLVSPDGFLIAADPAAVEPVLEGAGVTVALDDGRSAVDDVSPYLTADNVIAVGDALVAPERGLVLSQTDTGYRFEPALPVTAASPIAYRSAFALTSNRLGTAPIVVP